MKRSPFPASLALLTGHSAVRYLAVGLANTLVGLGITYFAMYAFALGNAPANFLGYFVGILLSFVLNKRWTFRDTGPTTVSFWRFLAVVCIAYAVNLAIVLMLADGLRLDPYIAQAAGIPPYTIVGYLGNRFFAFQKCEHGRS